MCAACVCTCVRVCHSASPPTRGVRVSSVYTVVDTKLLDLYCASQSADLLRGPENVSGSSGLVQTVHTRCIKKLRVFLLINSRLNVHYSPVIPPAMSPVGRQYVYQRFQTPCVWPQDGVAADDHRVAWNK